MKIARPGIAALLLIAVSGLILAFNAALARADASVDRQQVVSALFSLTPFVNGFDEPVGLAFTGAISDTRMFVLERRGVIWIVQQDGDIQPTPFLSITTKVTGQQGSYPEAGLLGLAFDPGYISNGRFYVYYTDVNGDIQLSRFGVSGNPEVANPAETPLLKIPHPVNRNHNGGQLAFGPDGYLYLGPGDGGGGGDTSNNAQNLAMRLGKILRINVSGVATYTVPATNPFTQTVGARPEIWALGLRNPWRFSFDRVTGDLYIGDVGQSGWEEIDHQPAASHGGENYGWRCYEGTHPYNQSAGCPGPYVSPVAEYSHDDGDGAITAGYVYRGSAYPALNGYFLYADFVSGRFWALQTTNCVSTALGHLAESPTSFGQDAAGELYVADLNGSIYRIVGHAPVPVQTPVWLPLLFAEPTAAC
jgi:glucose/arabinose dehydrogenase